MSKIRFLVDYRGVLTGENYYQAGDVVEHHNAAALVAEGRAEYVKAEKPAPEPEPVEKPEPEPEPVKKPAPKRTRKKKAAK